MSDFRVSISELTTKVTSLRELNAQFKSQVSEMESVEGNLNSMWEGEAKNAFHTAFQSDKGQMDNFYSIIESYAERLEAIAARYAQAEARNVEIASERTYSA
ncbi:MAG: WXG100 family type VII secretion target [Lachnospiraceae bacterium]|nr:WXG100 family type VII secretion target [Lachnospiraceae bacterium]